MTISKEDVKALMAEVLNESKKPATIQVDKNMLLQAFFALVLAAVFALAWNLPGRVTTIEHNYDSLVERTERRDLEIKEQTQQIHSQNKEILVSLNSIQQTRFRPEDFTQKIAPLQASVDNLSKEQDKLWNSLNDMNKSVTDNTIKIQKVLAK